jgi:hypothetical protein
LRWLEEFCMRTSVSGLSRLQNCVVVFIAVVFTRVAIQAEQVSTKGDGLYYLSSVQSAPEVRTQPETWTDGAATIRAGEKADIKILQAFVYSENNANTEFGIRLNTSDFLVDPKTHRPSIVLKVGDHWYSCFGWAGGKSGGPCNCLDFKAHNQDAAEAIAKSLNVKCHVLANPGYKLFAQFLPLKKEYGTNEPVAVKFRINNLDERMVIFRWGGQQRGSRDNQYGFRAMLSNKKGLLQSVPDVGSAINFGGLSQHVPIKPGGTFEDQVDLKKWFSFDQAGTYYIHGFYQLAFYEKLLEKDTFEPETKTWSDYVSADFVIVVK